MMHRIALQPLAPRLAAMEHNAALLRQARAEAAAQGAALAATPQASLTGAPLLDLARDADFLAQCERVVAALATETADGGPALLLGAPWMQDGRLLDGLLLLDGGTVLARRARHAAGPAPYAPGPAPGPVAFRGLRLGLLAGEDLSDPSVAETLAETGAELLLCAAATPFAPGRPDRVLDQAVARVVETGLPLAWVGLAGAGDEQVFSGGAFALNADRALPLRLPPFTPGGAVGDWRQEVEGWRCEPRPLPPAVAEPELLWRALVAGIAARAGQGGVAVPPDGEPLLAALARDACGDQAPGGALRLSAVDRAGWLLGEPVEGFAPLLGLYPSDVAALAAARGLPPPAPAPAEPVLRGLVEQGQPASALVAAGFSPVLVADVWRRVRAGGYNRPRAAPGLTLGRGPDRAYPFIPDQTDRIP